MFWFRNKKIIFCYTLLSGGLIAAHTSDFIWPFLDFLPLIRESFPTEMLFTSTFPNSLKILPDVKEKVIFKNLKQNLSQLKIEKKYVIS